MTVQPLVQPLTTGLSIQHQGSEENKAQNVAGLWENLSSKGNSGDMLVKIPSHWFYFFTSMLLSPENFGWASEFLSSASATHLSENQGSISFSIPKECPVSLKHCSVNDLSGCETLGRPTNEKNKGVMIQGDDEVVVPYKKRRASRRLAPM